MYKKSYWKCLRTIFQCCIIYGVPFSRVLIIWLIDGKLLKFESRRYLFHMGLDGRGRGACASLRCSPGVSQGVRILLPAFWRRREEVQSYASGKSFEDGEKPSSFFCTSERRCAESKVIKEVRSSRGGVVSGEGNGKVFHEFYSHLYSSVENVDVNIQNLFLDRITRVVSAEKAVVLDKPFQLNEIKKAFLLMAKNKSPGIDGLPSEFYISFLDFLGEDLLCIYITKFFIGRCFQFLNVRPSSRSFLRRGILWIRPIADRLVY